MEFMPFYPGQRVVCIRDHSQGIIKKGEVYTVLEIFKSCCFWSIDIGVVNSFGTNVGCPLCNHEFPSLNHLFAHVLFAAVEDHFKAITYSKVLEQEIIHSN